MERDWNQLSAIIAPHAYTHFKVGCLIFALSDLSKAYYYECEKHPLPTVGRLAGETPPECSHCGGKMEIAPVVLLTLRHYDRLAGSRQQTDEPTIVERPE